VQVLVLDVVALVSLRDVARVRPDREALRTPHRQDDVLHPVDTSAHASLLSVEDDIVVADQTVAHRLLAGSTAFSGAHPEGFELVVDATGRGVFEETYRHVHGVGVGTVGQIEGSYVALVLVVKLRTALSRLKICSVALDLADSEVPPGREVGNLEPEGDGLVVVVGDLEGGSVQGEVVVHVHVNVGNVSPEWILHIVRNGPTEVVEGNVGVPVVGGDVKRIGRIAFAVNHRLHVQVQEVHPHLAHPGLKIDSVQTVGHVRGDVGIVGVLEVGDILVGLVAAEAGESAASSRMRRHVVAEVTEAGGNSSLKTTLLVGGTLS